MSGFSPASRSPWWWSSSTVSLCANEEAPEPSESPKVEPTPVASALRPDLEKTPLSYYSDYWRQVGERVKPKIVLAGPGAHPLSSSRPASRSRLLESRKSKRRPPSSSWAVDQSRVSRSWRSRRLPRRGFSCLPIPHPFTPVFSSPLSASPPMGGSW